MESPWSGEGRGLVLQRIWSKSGVLLASCVQEVSLFQYRLALSLPRFSTFLSIFFSTQREVAIKLMLRVGPV